MAGRNQSTNIVTEQPSTVEGHRNAGRSLDWKLETHVKGLRRDEWVLP